MITASVLKGLKIRKESPEKDAIHLNNNKNSSHNKRYKKNIGKEEKIKNEKYKKSLTA